MPILSLASLLLSSESLSTQEFVKSLIEYCLLYRNGITSWNRPKVTIENIKWNIPVDISPLKIGTKKPKKKYVHEYPIKQDPSTPDSLCLTLIFCCQPKKMLPKINGDKIIAKIIKKTSNDHMPIPSTIMFSVLLKLFHGDQWISFLIFQARRTIRSACFWGRDARAPYVVRRSPRVGGNLPP